MSSYPGRVTMLDAITLDQEIFNILRSQLRTVLHIIPPWIITKHELMMDVILQYVIWKLSVTKFRGTFGQQLLNMKYRNIDMTDKKQNLILLSQILSYLHSHNFFSFPSSKVNDTVKKADIIIHICSLINLLRFFSQGKYPTLMDRLLNLRPVCIVNKPRSVGYNYMTRELLWHGFIELLTFTLSVVNYQYLRRKFNRLFAKPAAKSITNRSRGLDYTKETKCTICRKSPILPVYLGCYHAACYYCVKANTMVDANFECPDCGYFPLNTNTFIDFKSW